MKKLVILFLTTVLFSGMAQAVPVALVEYGTENGTTSLAPLTSDASVTATNLMAGTGLVSNPGTTFNFNAWDNTTNNFTDAYNNGDFWAFSFDVLEDIDLTTLDLRLDRSGTGPTDFEIRYSLDGATTTFVMSGSPSTTGTNYLNIDLSSISLSAGDTIAFGLIAWGASSSGGTFDLETFSGDVALRISGEVAAVPVPAAVWLFGSALMGLVGVRRKKA